MGRTVSSFRNVLEMEKQEWKPFRAALDKSERKEFDDMFDIPRLYITACTSSEIEVLMKKILAGYKKIGSKNLAAAHTPFKE